MRKLFSEYALFALTTLTSAIGLKIFIKVLYNNSPSLISIIEMWLSHLVNL